MENKRLKVKKKLGIVLFIILLVAWLLKSARGSMYHKISKIFALAIGAIGIFGVIKISLI